MEPNSRYENSTKLEVSARPKFRRTSSRQDPSSRVRVQASDGVNSHSDTITITVVPKEQRDLTQGRSIIDNPDNDKIKKQEHDSKNQTEKGQITISPFSSDSIPPRVISTNPTNGARGVSVGALIKATFSEPILGSSVTSSTFTVKTNTGYISGARSLTLQMVAELSHLRQLLLLNLQQHTWLPSLRE